MKKKKSILDANAQKLPIEFTTGTYISCTKIGKQKKNFGHRTEILKRFSHIIMNFTRKKSKMKINTIISII